MLLDVIKKVEVSESDSPLEISLCPKKWYFLLKLNNVDIFEAGNVCDTCVYYFEKRSEVESKPDTLQLTEQLKSGIKSLSESDFDDIKKIFPDGEYMACLEKVTPKFVKGGSEDDFFENRIQGIWEDTRFEGNFDPPKIDYYELAVKNIDYLRNAKTPPDGYPYKYFKDKYHNYRIPEDKDGFFEFAVPMFSKEHLNLDQVEKYKKDIESGIEPTAIALSLLQERAPSTFVDQEEIEFSKMLSLTHYILDGHHKFYAAALLGKPITLISLISQDYAVIDRGGWEFITENIETIL